jgi:hypothetical protein
MYRAFSQDLGQGPELFLDVYVEEPGKLPARSKLHVCGPTNIEQARFSLARSILGGDRFLCEQFVRRYLATWDERQPWRMTSDEVEAFRSMPEIRRYLNPPPPSGPGVG